MTDTTSPEAGAPAVGAARQAILLAEYAALRSEITTLLSLQGQFMNFSIVFFGLVVTMWNRTTGGLSEYLSLLPIPFGVLGLSYADVGFRIMRAAQYIQQELRPALDALGGANCLGWETYIRERHPARRLMAWMPSTTWG